jgi:hypothetical protein
VTFAGLNIPVWSEANNLAPAANPGQATGLVSVDIDTQRSMDAVTVTSVTVGTQLMHTGVSAGAIEIKPGGPLQAGNDWLQNTSITLKNRTDKTIVCIVLGLFFPDTGDGMSSSTPVTAYFLTVGRRPDVDSFSHSGTHEAPDPNAKPLLFLPGQTLVIHFSDYFSGIQTLIEQKVPLSRILRCYISREAIYFEDGMKWGDLSGFSTPDPGHPGKFILLDRGHYFPGDPSQNLPPIQ